MWGAEPVGHELWGAEPCGRTAAWDGDGGGPAVSSTGAWLCAVPSGGSPRARALTGGRAAIRVIYSEKL